jgi:hypothetical protein
MAAAKRLSERLWPPADPSASDLRPLPSTLNAAFTRILAAEAPLVRRMDLPYGLSLMALGRKPAPAAAAPALSGAAPRPAQAPAPAIVAA